MTYTKVGHLELDILINDQDLGKFYLGCSKCKKLTKDWNEFFNHLFQHLETEMNSFDHRNWRAKA